MKGENRMRQFIKVPFAKRAAREVNRVALQLLVLLCSSFPDSCSHFPPSWSPLQPPPPTLLLPQHDARNNEDALPLTKSLWLATATRKRNELCCEAVFGFVIGPISEHRVFGNRLYEGWKRWPTTVNCNGIWRMNGARSGAPRSKRH